MSIASNSTRVLNLKDATSVREALRMIADDPETPKRERKPSVEVLSVVTEIVDKEPEPDPEVVVVPAKASPEKSREAVASVAVTERKAPSVTQIECTLMKMAKDRKRHSQLIQIATSALSKLTPDEHCEVLVSQLQRLSPPQRVRVIELLKTSGK